ncbi:MAG: ribosome biogenesis GTPase Der [Myxococcales bacterium]|nr:ribosome biogenesis GTPase Der [Myxococcales bacterium]
MEEKLPRCALVGRPNVGKSTLFNRLTGRRHALVEDMPGVTRDRKYGHCEWNGQTFEVVDTGGLEPTTDDYILSAMRRQTQFAIEEADFVLVIVDARHGVISEDLEIINELRRQGKPFFLLVNKVDGPNQEALAAEFYESGLEKIYPISATHGAGVGDMLDDLLAEMTQAEMELPDAAEVVDATDGLPRIAVIGKPNAGKSTLINHLLGEERLLTMPEAGTTRDAIDVQIERDGKEYLFIDTAGIRRKKYIKERVEQLSINQSLNALDRCDVALFLVDATEGITEQDTKVAGFAHNKGRAVIIVVNKWDLMPKGQEAMKAFEEDLRYKMKYLSYAPIVFCSALTGARIQRLFQLIDKVYESFRFRIPTGELNRFFTEMMRYHPPPVYKRRPVKFYYITQIMVGPPTFLISANQPDAAHVTYQRFIMNSLRAEFGYEGVPIKLVFRRHH